MASRIASLQQSDGLWRASLLDPASYPGGEVSGSGFFCYAFAWGINNGLLDPKIYLPVVRKAWIGLNECVNEEGRVGWVQPIGADPRKNFDADSWEVYGTGAFLLAGSEVVKLKIEMIQFINNILFSSIFCLSACNPSQNGVEANPEATYRNPVINRSMPDPTVIKADDGYFYLYATEDIRNMPIYRSQDLVSWQFIGTVFTDQSRPTFEPNGGLWAPDINLINGKYVLYYSMSVWGGEQTCGIGVATADNPDGPFTDHGKLFRSNEIGVQNSIDPCFVEDNGKKYLFGEVSTEFMRLNFRMMVCR